MHNFNLVIKHSDKYGESFIFCDYIDQIGMIKLHHNFLMFTEPPNSIIMLPLSSGTQNWVSYRLTTDMSCLSVDSKATDVSLTLVGCEANVVATKFIVFSPISSLLFSYLDLT